jgi:hypothetical protein
MTGFDAAAAERALAAANFALLVPFHRCLVSWGPTAAVEAPPPAAADAQSALSSAASEVISLFDADAVRVLDWWPTAQFGTVLALSVAPSSLSSSNSSGSPVSSSSSLVPMASASLSNPSSPSSSQSSLLYLLHEASPGAAPDVSCLRTATAVEFVTYHLPALCRAAISASAAAASAEAALASESASSVETGDSSPDTCDDNVALALRELVALRFPSSSSSSSSSAVALCVCGAAAIPNSTAALASSSATVATATSGLSTVATVGAAAPFACVRRVGTRALLHAAADAESMHLQPIESGDQSIDGDDGGGIDDEFQDSEQSSADGMMLSLLLLALSRLAPFAVSSAAAPIVAKDDARNIPSASAASRSHSAARILSALLARVDAAEKHAQIENSSDAAIDSAGAGSATSAVADPASQSASAASSSTSAPSAVAPSPWSDAQALFVRVLRQWHSQYIYRRQQWRRQQRQQQQQRLEAQAQKLQASSSARIAADSTDNRNVTSKSSSSTSALSLSVALSSAAVLLPPNQSSLPLSRSPVSGPLSAIAENAADSPTNMAQIDASATFPTPVVWRQTWHCFLIRKSCFHLKLVFIFSHRIFLYLDGFVSILAGG